MKIPCFFIALICLTIYVRGQAYIPFPTEKASWFVYLETTCENDHNPDVIFQRYILTDNTEIINEHTH